MSLKDAHKFLDHEDAYDMMGWVRQENFGELFSTLFFHFPFENPDWPFEKLVPLAYSEKKSKYILNSQRSAGDHYCERNKLFGIDITLHMSPVKSTSVDQASHEFEWVDKKHGVADWNWCSILRCNGMPDQGEGCVLEFLMDTKAVKRFLNMKMQYVAPFPSLSLSLSNYEY